MLGKARSTHSGARTSKRRHVRSANRRLNRFAGGLVFVGIACSGVLVTSTVLARKDIGASTRPPTGSTTIPVSTRPGSTTTPVTTRPSTLPGSTSTTLAGGQKSNRPAGLIQVGDSKTACISGGPGPGLIETERVLGITYNCIETYTDVDHTWASWVTPWITSRSEPFVAWVAADPTGHQLIDTQNLIPDSEKTNPNWTGECAAGDFNVYAEQFATNMVDAGFGYSVIRLGHEMNGTWENDSLGNTLAQWRQWAQCFIQEEKAMRAVPGEHFLFEWNVNEGYRVIPLADYYPGDAYVDIIGLSFYDQSGNPLPPVGDANRWHALVSEPMGLNQVYAFAAQHGKPFSLPEWGTVTTQGDDGNYVANVGAFVASHDVAYQAWFNAGDLKIFQLNLTQDPRSVAAVCAHDSSQVNGGDLTYTTGVQTGGT